MQFELTPLNRLRLLITAILVGSLASVTNAQQSPLTLPGPDLEPTLASPALSAPGVPALDSPMQFGPPTNTAPQQTPAPELPATVSTPTTPLTTPALNQIMNNGAVAQEVAPPANQRQPELVAQLPPRPLIPTKFRDW